MLGILSGGRKKWFDCLEVILFANDYAIGLHWFYNTIMLTDVERCTVDCITQEGKFE